MWMEREEDWEGNLVGGAYGLNVFAFGRFARHGFYIGGEEWMGLVRCGFWEKLYGFLV